MKFLLLYDIYSSRKKVALLALTYVVSLFVCYVLNRMWMFSCLYALNLVTGISLVRFLSDDNKKVKWEEYQWALPIKKSAIVNEKFTIFLIITAIVIAMNFLVLLLTRDRWYTNNEIELDSMVSQCIMMLFFVVSIMFIALMAELISGTKGTNIAITLIGFLILLGVTVGSLYMVQGYYTYLLDDIGALTILGSLILVVTLVITYTISISYIKKSREIL